MKHLKIIMFALFTGVICFSFSLLLSCSKSSSPQGIYPSVLMWSDNLYSTGISKPLNPSDIDSEIGAIRNKMHPMPVKDGEINDTQHFGTGDILFSIKGVEITETIAVLKGTQYYRLDRLKSSLGLIWDNRVYMLSGYLEEVGTKYIMQKIGSVLRSGIWDDKAINGDITISGSASGELPDWSIFPVGSKIYLLEDVSVDQTIVVEDRDGKYHKAKYVKRIDKPVISTRTQDASVTPAPNIVEGAQFTILSSLLGKNVASSHNSFAWNDGIVIYNNYDNLTIEFINSRHEVIYKEFDSHDFQDDKPFSGVLRAYGDDLIFTTAKYCIFLDNDFNIKSKIDLNEFQFQQYAYIIFRERDTIVYTREGGVYISSISKPSPVSLFSSTKTDEILDYDSYSVVFQYIDEGTVLIAHSGYEKLKSLILYNLDSGKKIDLDIKHNLGFPENVYDRWHFVSFIEDNNQVIMQIGDLKSGKVKRIPSVWSAHGPDKSVAINWDKLFFIQENDLRRLNLHDLSIEDTGITVNASNAKVISVNESGNILLLWSGSYILINMD